ncbi:MAG: hypothetical protein ACOCQD_05280 [archaeon]
MRICEHCGITEKETRIIHYKRKKYLCRKHYLQVYNHGKIFRTVTDKNKITIKGNVAEVELYNIDSDVIAVTIIDKEDVDRVKDYKMNLNNNGYVRINTSNGERKILHRYLLGTDGFVDHINHNKLDNRKINLRITDKQKNAYNMDKGLEKGVNKTSNGKKFYAGITNNYDGYFLGTYEDKKYAIYARYIGEQIFCPNSRDKQYDDEKMGIFNKISDKRKEEIEKYVQVKILEKQQ